MDRDLYEKYHLMMVRKKSTILAAFSKFAVLRVYLKVNFGHSYAGHKASSSVASTTGTAIRLKSTLPCQDSNEVSNETALGFSSIIDQCNSQKKELDAEKIVTQYVEVIDRRLDAGM